MEPPKLLKILEITPAFFKVEILIFNKFAVDGVFDFRERKILILGDSFAKAMGFSDFMEMLDNDFWFDFIDLVVVDKHSLYGWVFYVK
jgi:hypothetical protein